MGTRSLIAAKYDDQYKVIYCHWDGYLDGVGLTLEEHYQDQQKIDALINLGDISSLENECTCPDGHCYSEQTPGFTVAYHRDRGEDWEDVKPKEAASLSDIKNINMGQEFIYVFQDGRWHVLANDESLTPILEAIAKDSEDENA